VALKRWIKSLGDYAIILILLTEYDREAAIKRVFARVGFVLLPLSILFIKYYPNLGRGYASHWDGTQFFVGVADTKNMLGMTCMVFGFAAAWRVLQAWGEPHRERNRILVLHGIVVLTAIWLLILSDSKTSLSCFLLTSALIAFHTVTKFGRRRAVVHTLVATEIVVCFSVLFLGIGSGALESMGRNASLTGRTDIWEVLFKVPVNPILGTGFESFWLGKRLSFLWSFPIVDGINEAHNGYLEVYLNLGLIGVAFLLILLWTGYRNVVEVLERNPAAGRLQLGFLVIALIYNFTEAGIRSTDLVWVALIFSVIGLPKRQLRPTPTNKVYTEIVGLTEAEQFV
jgi:exopolysaccharide production protein ExoQ